MKAAVRIFLLSLIAFVFSGIHNPGSTLLLVEHNGEPVVHLHQQVGQFPVQYTGFRSTPELPAKLKNAIRIKALQSECSSFIASAISCSYPLAVFFADKEYALQHPLSGRIGIYKVHRLRGPPALQLV